MLNFCLDSNGDLVFIPSERVMERIEFRHARARDLLESMVKTASDLRFAGSPSLLSKHPSAHALVSYRDGHLEPSQAGEEIKILTALTLDQVERLRINRLSVCQNSALLPLVVSGTTALIVDPKAPSDIGALDLFMDEVSAIAGFSWDKFRAPVNICTFVCVPGMPDLPYFSGSTSSIWGAVHMSTPSTQGILAESLTHEAAHFWLHAIEDFGELAEQAWSDESWVSPWRNDPRPVAGIIHGIYVFSAAASVLTKLVISTSQIAGGIDRAVIGKRAAVLIAQIEEGIREINRSGRATTLGLQLINDGERRLPVLREALGIELLETARGQICKRREQKVANWSERGFQFVQ